MNRDDVIEKAARAISTQTTCDGQPWPTEVHQRQARALAAEGLLATRPAPSREEIARVYFARKAEIAAETIGLSEPVRWEDLTDEDRAALRSGADAVLALLHQAPERDMEAEEREPVTRSLPTQDDLEDIIGEALFDAWQERGQNGVTIAAAAVLDYLQEQAATRETSTLNENPKEDTMVTDGIRAQTTRGAE